MTESKSISLSELGQALKQTATMVAEARQAEEAARPPPPPSLHELCLNVPLYRTIDFDPQRDEQWVEQIKFGAVQWDMHCVECGAQSTFRSAARQGRAELNVLKGVSAPNKTTNANLRHLVLGPGQYSLVMHCQRRGHSYTYFFSVSAYRVQKIGQSPSMEDVSGVEIERYRKILGPDYSEMKKAGGLISHGIGIGAFVYLRRIFERLIETTRREADPSDADRVAFYQMRMAERINALKHLLPDAVVEYRETYGILSKGVHELSEDECKSYFPVIRAAIIAMLEQRYEQEERKRAGDALKAAVKAIAGEVKSKG